MNHVRSQFAHRMRTAREARGWSKYQLAQAAQSYSGDRWHTTVVTRLEAGETRPALDQAATLSLVLHFSLDDMREAPPVDDQLDGSLATLRELDEQLAEIDDVEDAELPEIVEEVR